MIRELVPGLVLFLMLGLTISPAASQSSSDETTVGITVDRACDMTGRDFRFLGQAYSEELDAGFIGLNASGNFQHLPVNLGELSYSNYRIDIESSRTAEAAISSPDDDDTNETDDGSSAKIIFYDLISEGDERFRVETSEYSDINGSAFIEVENLDIEESLVNFTEIEEEKLDVNQTRITGGNLTSGDQLESRIFANESSNEPLDTSSIRVQANRMVAEQSYIMNSTNNNAEQNLTQFIRDEDLLEPEVRENESQHYVRPFRHNRTDEIIESHNSSELIGYNSSWMPFQQVIQFNEFFAGDTPPGEYTGRLSIDYQCGFEATEASRFSVESDDSISNKSEFLEWEEDANKSDIVEEVEIDGLNISDVEQRNPLSVVTVLDNRTFEARFFILDTEGEGVIPDDVSEDDEVDQDVDTDAEEPDEADTEFDVDADEPLDEADEREGDDSDFPGETEVPDPEPEPDPDPQPLLSLSIMPLNSTYEAPRGRFTEIGLEVENIGLEPVNDLELEPRFSEAMDWEAQIGNIDSLEVDESVNSSVYVNPSESVDPGIYQVPVYGSNPDGDIALQYVNVEVTEDIFQGVLNIEEAPRDVRFEQGQNYTLPLILSNNGETEVENVEIELNNYEACGTYSVDPIDNIESGSDVSATIQFQAGDDLEECSATIIASSDSGDLAFSELNIDVREEIGFVPEEFRVPIVASLWTLMLLAYAVLTKKYGVHNMTVKVPLVLLVVGEAFIIIYLSSTYYNLAPPGLLPF